MKKIPSFTVNHEDLLRGIYVSRKDVVGEEVITTFDIRTKLPNREPVMNTAEIHTIEHLAATFLRNHPQAADQTIYFGPMGCQTGFYLLFDSRQLSDAEAVELVKETFAAGAVFEGPMPGKSAAECGNYINLDVELAKRQCAVYSEIVREWTVEKLAY